MTYVRVYYVYTAVLQACLSAVTCSTRSTGKKTLLVNRPSIADMVEKAINILKRSDDGYFLFVEGSFNTTISRCRN